MTTIDAKLLEAPCLFGTSLWTCRSNFHARMQCLQDAQIRMQCLQQLSRSGKPSSELLSDVRSSVWSNLGFCVHGAVHVFIWIGREQTANTFAIFGLGPRVREGKSRTYIYIYEGKMFYDQSQSLMQASEPVIYQGE